MHGRTFIYVCNSMALWMNRTVQREKEREGDAECKTMNERDREKERERARVREIARKR